MASKTFINPLETAIKKGKIDIAKLLMIEYKFSPMVLSSNFRESLLEVSSQINNKIF
jgi:uncharacterized membrane protein YwzB